MDPKIFDMEIEIKTVCRICLQKIKKGSNIFSDQKGSKDILEKIYLCFQIILNYDKYLPNMICNVCIEELNMANNFRLKCISFEERFEPCLKQMSSKQQERNNSLRKESDNLNEEMEIFEDTHESTSETVITTDKFNEQNNVNKVKNYKCVVCDKTLKSESSLLKHNISMHQKRKHKGNVTGFGSTRRYHCTSCSYSTPHSQTLVNHMRRHDGERPYQCGCGKSFTQSSSLAAHQKTHSNTTYFTCSMCGKQFKHAFTLKNHQRVHEAGGLTCSICQKVLKSKQSLRDHMHRHYNIRNYNCEDCGDTFITSSELLNHRKKHTIEKRIACHLCGYKTHTKKNLVLHLKRHAGEKTIKCDLCEISFYTRGDLRRHRRVHTREKPYCCPTCAQRFTHSPSLNKHMQTVHGIEYKWGDFKWKETRNIKFVLNKLVDAGSEIK